MSLIHTLIERAYVIEEFTNFLDPSAQKNISAIIKFLNSNYESYCTQDTKNEEIEQKITQNFNGYIEELIKALSIDTKQCCCYIEKPKEKINRILASQYEESFPTEGFCISSICPTCKKICKITTTVPTDLPPLLSKKLELYKKTCEGCKTKANFWKKYEINGAYYCYDCVKSRCLNNINKMSLGVYVSSSASNSEIMMYNKILGKEFDRIKSNVYMDAEKFSTVCTKCGGVLYLSKFAEYLCNLATLNATHAGNQRLLTSNHSYNTLFLCSASNYNLLIRLKIKLKMNELQRKVKLILPNWKVVQPL